MSIKPTQKHKQGNLMYPDLLDQLNPKHPLLQLGSAIPWGELEGHHKPPKKRFSFSPELPER